MKSQNKVVVIAVALLFSALSSTAHAQAGSPINDLLAKGKTALNDFKYRTADSVAHQLLKLDLSRQQRIDVLQLLAATMYPDDEAEQKKDSAAAVIRHLVALGVNRAVTRDISWPGLDALYASVSADFQAAAIRAQGAAAAAAPATAVSARPVAYDSVATVLALVGDGRHIEEIVQRVNLDCYTFSFDELDAALKRVRSPAGLSNALKRTCSRLIVETEPAHANLRVATRELGTVPERGQMWWVEPGRAAEIEVSSGAHRISKVVEFPRGRVVSAKFFLPKDTLVWPIPRTPVQIAQDLSLFDRWTPRTPRPPEPIRPSSVNAMAVGTLWGFLGAAGGYAAAQFLPAAGCVVNETVPQGETWKDPRDGKRYNGGQTMNLGGGMPCTMTIAGGTGVGLFLFSSIMKTAGNRSKNSRYAHQMRLYPETVREWEDTEKRAFAERSPDVRQAVADQQIKLAQAQAENSNIRARNARLPEPQIVQRDLQFAETFAAARPAAEVLTSDIDVRVPKAAVANPHAVAVVIGNRDYLVDGVPKVDYAIRDAKSMAKYLVEAFGFSEDRVILDTNATTGRLSELFGTAADANVGTIADMIASRPRDSVDVFVFYSGHGAPDGRPAKRFLVPVDANPDRLRATGYNMDQLYKNLSALNARSVTVAIDACFSGLSDAGSVFTGRSAMGGQIEVEVATVGGSNTQVFTAATAEQTARWRKDQGHGLFTYFFLKGVQGAADANGDSNITAGELEAYVRSNVRTYALERLSGARQTPEVFTDNPDRIVVSLKKAGN